MSINDYYRNQLERAKQEILNKRESYILGADTDELLAYYRDMICLPLIEKDEDRIIETSRKPVTRRTRSGFAIGRDFIVTIKIPIIHHDKIREVLTRQPQTYFQGKYNLDYQNGWIITQTDISSEGSGQENRIKSEIDTIDQVITQKNNNVKSQNDSFDNQLRTFIDQQKVRIKSDDAFFDSILKKIPYEIKQKDKIKAQPVNIKVKKSIQPIYPSAQIPTEPVLERERVNAVIEIISNAGLGFEVTPHVYNLLEEEYLRDIILGYLNAIFSLGATGETFVKNGKTDIHIRLDKGSIFSAECKKWNGEKLYGETIDQLFSYLVWRQNYGVVITFSNRMNFSQVIEKAKETSLNHETCKSDKCRDVALGHFVTENVFPDDANKVVTFHHLLFNLYSG